MNDVDRDLSTRLAATPVAPRPSWVAGLRADLGASWVTGELPGKITPLPPKRPRWRSTRRTWAVAFATAAVAAGAVLVVADDSDDASIAPAVSTNPNSTTGDRPTLAPTTTPPTAPTTTITCGGFDPSALAYITIADTTAWTVTPDDCVDGNGMTTGFTITSGDLETSAPSVSRHVDLTELTGSSSIELAASDVYPDQWGNLALAGVSGTTVIMRTNNAVIWIEMQTDAITVQSFREAHAPEWPNTYMSPLLLVGDAAFTILPRVGDAGMQQGLMRINRDTGELEETAGIPTDVSYWNVGTSDSSTRMVPAVLDALWYTDMATNVLTRVDPDGSLRNTPLPVKVVMAAPPSADTVWALAVQLDQTWDPLDHNSPARMFRLDLATGAILTTLAENPPNSYCTTFGFFAATSGVLAMCDPERLWWLDNEGRYTTLAPVDGVPIGMTGDRVIIRTADNNFVTIDINDLLAAAATTTTTAP